MSKKGSVDPAKVMMGLVIIIIVALIMLWWVGGGIKKASNTTDTLVQCESQGQGAGCFAESAVNQKVAEQFTCTRGLLGCKADSAAPYCCYRLFT
jgi:hypothetical protein